MSSDQLTNALHHLPACLYIAAWFTVYVMSALALAGVVMAAVCAMSRPVFGIAAASVQRAVEMLSRAGERGKTRNVA